MDHVGTSDRMAEAEERAFARYVDSLQNPLPTRGRPVLHKPRLSRTNSERE